MMGTSITQAATNALPTSTRSALCVLSTLAGSPGPESSCLLFYVCATRTKAGMALSVNITLSLARWWLPVIDQQLTYVALISYWSCRTGGTTPS